MKNYDIPPDQHALAGAAKTKSPFVPPCPPVGRLLRDWRRRRRLSQLDLATQVNVSARHLSFVETGRARPSREMVLRLAEHLQVPLRERKVLLSAAGFAADFTERPFAHAELGVVRSAVEAVLAGHEPFPAFAIDRHWTLVASNGGFRPFLGDIDPNLLRSPVNVLRLTLSPRGLGRRLANYAQWRLHVLSKLQGQILASGDPVLVDLHRELRDYPAPLEGNVTTTALEDWHRLVVPFQLATSSGILSFYSTTTIFGTPLDVTLSEISLECFYPADAATARILRSEVLPPR